MRYLKYVALLAVLMVPFAYSQAQVAVGIGVGPVGVRIGPGYVAGPPVCSYGYYDYYPYACAPYGYYGPNWFVNGIFIGAGPWYHGYGRGWDRDGWRHDGWGRAYVGRGWGYGHEGYARGYAREGYSRAYAGRGYAGGGFHSGNSFHGGGYGGAGFRSGGGFHGGGGHGGGHR